MMYQFLTNNRDELIARCKLKVAQRPRRDATEQQLYNGVPLFLDQLTRTLKAGCVFTICLPRHSLQ